MRFFLQHKFSQSTQRKKTILEKVEAAYALCQKAYDGHHREITLYEQTYTRDTVTYLHKRKHPGQDVSDLKMLIRCYFPAIESALEELDLSHKVLKKKFALFDAASLQAQQHESDSHIQEVNNLRRDLERFGHACNVIKLCLTDQAKKTAT